MSWHDNLRRVVMSDGRVMIGASFRGVPFYVESVEESGGRRAVVHEFPLRDDPFVEDMGASAKSYRVDAYVIGDDYLAQKQKLLDAVSAAGPGQFVHPEKGEIIALCRSYSTRYTRTEGRYSVFALDFVEAPTQLPAPSIVVDSSSQVDAAADAAATASDAEFAAKYTTAGLPGFSFASGEAAISAALDGLKEKLAPVIDDTQELAAMNGQISLGLAEATSLVRTPALVTALVRDTIQSLTNTITDAPGALMDALSDAYLVDLGAAPAPTTATRTTEGANLTALQNAIRRVFAVEAARLATSVPFTTIDDALAARDTIAGMLEEQAELADDTAYPALVDLRSQVLRAVPGGQAFARVVTVTRNVPVPAIVLAYQLYGSAELEDDVVARNPDVRHPGFMVGDLKVLSDG